MRIAVLVLCLLWTSIGEAATWYVNPSLDVNGAALTYGAGNGTTYATAWAGCAAITGVSAGDRIELDTAATFYERCVLALSGTNGHPITIRGSAGGQAIFDQTVNVSNDQSFTAGPVYVTTGFPWTLVSGNVYKKTTSDYIFIMTDNGTLMTGVVCAADDEATAVTRLTAGTFCTRTSGKTLYVYTSDGAAPSTHMLRSHDRSQDANIGGIFIDGRSNLTLSGILCKHLRLAKVNATENACLVLRNDTNITLAGQIEVTESFYGISIDGGTNIQFLRSATDLVNSHHNESDGLTMEGWTSSAVNHIIRGTFDYNGNIAKYNVTASSYTQDGDGIGIGQRGGTLTNIHLDQVQTNYNGPRDKTVTATMGTGIFVGTADAMSAEVHVHAFTSIGNHNPGVALGTGWIGGRVYGGLVTDNCGVGASNRRAMQVATGTTVTVPVSVSHVTFAYNSCRAALQVDNNNGVVATVENNIFFNNGSALDGTQTFGADYQGDLWVLNSLVTTPIIEDNNIYWRSGTNGFDTAKAIQTTGTDYTQLQLLGGAGTWQGDTTNGDHNLNSNPLFLSTSDFRLTLTSPARGAGTAAIPCLDVRGRACRNPPAIGGYQPTSGDQASTRTARSQYIFQPVASSTFSSGNANPISESGVWAVDQSGSGSMKILSGVVQPTDDSLDSGARYVGTGFNANQYSRAALTSSGTGSTGGGGSGQGLSICASSSARSMYRFTADHAVSNNASIYRFVTGTGGLVTAWTTPFVNGDIFTLANVGETLYVFNGSTLIKTIDDTGGGVGCAATRFPGLAYSSTDATGSIDTWSGGNFRLAY